METKDNVKIHDIHDDETAEPCKLGHKAFLFFEDVTDRYASAYENRVYYHCACLECGAYGNFQMSRIDRREKTIYTNFDAQNAFNSYYEVRKKYLELIGKGITIEESVSQINLEYKNENNKILKKKCNNSSCR